MGTDRLFPSSGAPDSHGPEQARRRVYAPCLRRVKVDTRPMGSPGGGANRLSRPDPRQETGYGPTTRQGIPSTTGGIPSTGASDARESDEEADRKECQRCGPGRPMKRAGNEVAVHGGSFAVVLVYAICTEG
jgi:hypothetical protein